MVQPIPPPSYLGLRDINCHLAMFTHIEWVSQNLEMLTLTKTPGNFIYCLLKIRLKILIFMQK